MWNRDSEKKHWRTSTSQNISLLKRKGLGLGEQQAVPKRWIITHQRKGTKYVCFIFLYYLRKETSRMVNTKWVLSVINEWGVNSLQSKTDYS